MKFNFIKKPSKVICSIYNHPLLVQKTLKYGTDYDLSELEYNSVLDVNKYSKP